MFATAVALAPTPVNAQMGLGGSQCLVEGDFAGPNVPNLPENCMSIGDTFGKQLQQQDTRGLQNSGQPVQSQPNTQIQSQSRNLKN
jgi:hypothetical protein